MVNLSDIKKTVIVIIHGCIIIIKVTRVLAGLYTILKGEGWARSQVRTMEFHIELPAGLLATMNNNTQ